MRALSDIRKKIDEGVANGVRPLTTLEQRGQKLQTQVTGLPKDLQGRLNQAEAKLKQVAAHVNAEHRKAAADIARLPKPAQAAAKSRLDDLGRGIVAAYATPKATTAELRVAVGELEKIATTLSASIKARMQTVVAARKEIQAKGKVASDTLDQWNKKLTELRQSLQKTLKSKQDEAMSVIKAIEATTVTFVNDTTKFIDELQSLIREATQLAVAGVATLSDLVNQLTSKADALVTTMESTVLTVLGAIDKVPVDALPEPMAKPAVAAIEQVTTQFSTQLQSGAKAASAQLKSVATQVTQTINTQQASVLQSLQAALKPTFDRVDQVLQQIAAKEKELKSTFDAAIKTFETARDQLLAQANVQIEALLEPALSELNTLIAAIGQTSDQLCADLDKGFSIFEGELAAARAGIPKLDGALTALGSTLDTMSAQASLHFSNFRSSLT